MDHNMALPEEMQVRLLRLFTELIEKDKEGTKDNQEARLCQMQICMSAPANEGGLGGTNVMIKLAEGENETVAYEAINFGIALLEVWGPRHRRRGCGGVAGGVTGGRGGQRHRRRRRERNGGGRGPPCAGPVARSVGRRNCGGAPVRRFGEGPAETWGGWG